MKGGRIVFAAFGSSLPVLLDRLMEVNYKEDLPNYTIIALPFGIEPFKKPSAQNLLSTYQIYASIFRPVTE